MTRIAIVGGGPAGYESALVAASLGAEVTLIEADGVGGACVLFDCVPSKTLIATSDKVTAYRDSPAVGVGSGAEVHVDMAAVNDRIKHLATAQSNDIRRRLVRDGVSVLAGHARFAAEQDGRTHRIEVVDADGCVARGARGRRRPAVHGCGAARARRQPARRRTHPVLASGL